MNGVLVGADLMYRQDGRIVPVEINTNTGWDDINRVEKEEDVFDLSDLKQYIADHNIVDVFLEGSISRIAKYWPEDMGAAVHTYTDTNTVLSNSSENYLVIRSSYSDEAYVDSFCRDKVNFLKAIEDRDYGCEFVWNERGILKGKITAIEDNGDFPNFVVKYRYPQYNRAIYPMFVRFETMKQLNDWVAENLEEDYVIMPFYFNEEKGMWNDCRLKLIRNWTVWVANEEGTLDSIYIGKYTKLTAEITDEVIEWDEHGNPVDREKVHSMFNTNGWFKRESGDLLVESDDVILMENDTWKTAEELQAGDRVKAVTVPTNGSVDIHKNVEDYNVSFEELQRDSEFTVNEVQSKTTVEGWIDETVMYFTDNTEWFDSDSSSYPVLDQEDGSVTFKLIKDIEIGDKVILMPAGNAHLESPEFVLREVERVEKRRVLQRGFSISLNGNHLFLSKTQTDTEAYVAIEHNREAYMCCHARESSINGICSSSVPTELKDWCMQYNTGQSWTTTKQEAACRIGAWGSAVLIDSLTAPVEICDVDYTGDVKVTCLIGTGWTSCAKNGCMLS